MRTQPRLLRNQLVRIAAIATIGSCAVVVAILLKWLPFSMGGATEPSAPATLSALRAQSTGANAAPAVAEQGSNDNPAKPTCAGLTGIAPTAETETAGGSGVNVGCSVVTNLAGDMPASNQSDVDTFLAWHVQAHDSIQYAYQSTLWGPSRAEARNDRPQRPQQRGAIDTNAR